MSESFILQASDVCVNMRTYRITKEIQYVPCPKNFKFSWETKHNTDKM